MSLTRMEAHAAKRNSGPVPGTGPMLSFDDLDETEMQIISRELRESLKTNNPKSQREYYRALHQILVKYGIMCHHPVELRLYDGFHRARGKIDRQDSKWYSCEMCECLVINR